MPSFRERSA